MDLLKFNFIWIFFLSPLKGAEFRYDLLKPIKASLCPTNSQPSLDSLFGKISSAQIQGQVYQSFTPIKQLQKRAKKLAELNQNNGIVYGNCSQSKRSFALNLPATKPLKITRSYLLLPQIPCQSFEAYFSRVLSGIPKKLTVKNRSITHTQLPAGFISIYCKGYSSTQQSKTLYIYSHKNLQPSLSRLSKSLQLVNEDHSVITWLNKKRGHSKLAKLNLKINQSNMKLDHQAKQITTIKKSLRKQGYLFVGENRVIAKDLKHALKLLWLSAKHRKLLLNPLAQFLMINPQNKNNKILYQIILAKRISDEI
jgi:hypothetical protein